VGFVGTPSGDPASMLLNTAVVLCFAIPGYLVGLRHGRMPAEMRDKAAK
jgi:hypothetical protein